MTRKLWLKQHQWLLAGVLLACLALVVVFIIWAVQAHQYQLTLADYNATLHQTNQSTGLPGNRASGSFTLPSYPPRDASGPWAWGFSGWAIRLFAILAPLLPCILLQRREQRQQRYLRIHKVHIDHATNKLAEAIGINHDLPESVFDAYSKLRELESYRLPGSPSKKD